MFELTEDRREALAEILNIAVGQAGRALSEMVEDTVTLSVPSVVFVPAQEIGAILRERAGASTCAVREAFDGPFAGEALLVFPEDKSLQLIRHLIGENSDLENITELEQDALVEMGNVILTSCTMTFADVFGVEMENPSLPEILRGSPERLLGIENHPSDHSILYLEVDFGVRGLDLSGIILIVFGIADAKKLIAHIDAYLRDLQLSI